ncbi:hypothetical protein PVAND_015494 [Polypedilum vanderplanki]|uniref:Uncharacterized protein n=1 Tax=Polypedilum vanderplanki TaxID=319348 RepID=A0A9J6BDA4_POLVA|nr:hypothetical protein PVAND_015494 [Polypedilum vanderplanki]
MKNFLIILTIFVISATKIEAEDSFSGNIESKRFCPPSNSSTCQYVPFYVVSDSTKIQSDNYEITSAKRDENVKGFKFFYDGDGLNPNVEFLPIKLSQFFPKLMFYKVNYQGIKSIKKVNFEGLTSLENLELKDNEIVEIAPGTFDDLYQLRSLNLFNNKLKKIDEFLLKNNQKLLSIDISMNQISELAPKTFENQQELKELSIWSCGLLAIDENLFKNLNKLEELDLRYNEFWQLPVEVFNGLKNVKFINLSKNKITYLDERIFNENKNLEKISLYQNRIHALSSKTFDGLKKLIIIDLGWNKCIDKRYGSWDKDELLSQSKINEMKTDLDRDCK